MLGTQCEFDENTIRTTKNPTLSHSLEEEKKKTWALGACYPTFLTTRILFFVYLCFLPILSQANGKSKIMDEYYEKNK